MNTSTTSATETFLIPVANMSKVLAKINKLNQVASKLAVGRITLTVGEKTMVEKKSPGKESTYQEYQSVTVSGIAPQLKGWRFLGTIDHADGLNIVNKVPGVEFPKQYIGIESNCDHCHTNRYRKETFIVEEVETGRLMQVGRSCLKDFLGHQDPKDVLSMLSYVNSFMTEIRNEESGFYGNGNDKYIQNDDLLAVTAACIRIDGWVPRSRVDEMTMATANAVKYYFFGCGNEHPEFVSSHAPNNADKNMAADATTWLDGQTANNEYMSNIKALDDAGFTSAKYFGYTCSIIAAYQRVMEKLEIRKAENNEQLNEYFGEIKKRSRNVEVKVLSKRWSNFSYGGKTLYRMITTKGNVIMWWCSTDVALEVGEQYTLDFTVIKHKVYEGLKQTTVNRAKVL